MNFSSGYLFLQVHAFISKCSHELRWWFSTGQFGLSAMMRDGRNGSILTLILILLQRYDRLTVPHSYPLLGASLALQPVDAVSTDSIVGHFTLCHHHKCVKIGDQREVQLHCHICATLPQFWSHFFVNNSPIVWHLFDKNQRSSNSTAELVLKTVYITCASYSYRAKSRLFFLMSLHFSYLTNFVSSKIDCLLQSSLLFSVCSHFADCQPKALTLIMSVCCR